MPLGRGVLIGAGLLLASCVLLALYLRRVERKQQERAVEHVEWVRAEVITVFAPNLWDEYHKDPVDMRARYDGHSLVVTGKVFAATPIARDEFLLLLRMREKGTTMQATVRADAAATAKLQAPNGPVTLNCDGIAYDSGSPALTGCSPSS